MALFQRQVEPMKIVRHEEPIYPMRIFMCGGASDGRVFKLVDTHMDDGSVHGLWISDDLDGYFRQVFVSWDFKHEKILTG
jgi:hypothetical protein